MEKYIAISNEDYREAAIELAKKYGLLPSEHVLDIMASVMMHRDDYMRGGDFVTAICNNDLAEAVFRADKECLENIKLFVIAKRYGHVK